MLSAAHSLGCVLIAHFTRRGRAHRAEPHQRVIGASSARSWWHRPTSTTYEPRPTPDCLRRFAPLPVEPFGFLATVIASRDDTFCGFPRAERLTASWSATLVDASALGRTRAHQLGGCARPLDEGDRGLERLAV